MAVRYYDDALIMKLQSWLPEASPLRILKPDESKRLFELTADDNKDQPLQMPFIALSRNNDIELLLNIKGPRSYDGLRLIGDVDNTALLNVIPIKLEYQLDIYAKRSDEADEYMRNILFKLINNPVIKIEIPYNSDSIQTFARKIDKKAEIEHIANIRVLSTVSDTSGISERLFSGQFSRWTIGLEIQDAFLFSIPYKRNWKLNGVEFSAGLEWPTTPETEPALPKTDIPIDEFDFD